MADTIYDPRDVRLSFTNAAGVQEEIAVLGDLTLSGPRMLAGSRNFNPAPTYWIEIPGVDLDPETRAALDRLLGVPAAASEDVAGADPLPDDLEPAEDALGPLEKLREGNSHGCGLDVILALRENGIEATMDAAPGSVCIYVFGSTATRANLTLYKSGKATTGGKATAPARVALREMAAFFGFDVLS